MNDTKLRRLSLQYFIAFWAITRLYAVAIVLVGKFGEFEFKVIAFHIYHYGCQCRIMEVAEA